MDRTPGITVTLMRSRCSRTVCRRRIQNFFQARLPHLVGNGRVAKCVAQDSGIGAAVHWHTGDRERIPHHRFHAQGEGVGVHAAMGVEQGPVNVEEVGVAVVPAKSFADGYEALSRRRLQPAGFCSLGAHRLFVAQRQDARRVADA